MAIADQDIAFIYSERNALRVCFRMPGEHFKKHQKMVVMGFRPNFDVM
jgi:hypothetical protein